MQPAEWLFASVFAYRSVSDLTAWCPNAIGVVQVVRELHVIDWNDVQSAKVPYRSISDYVASSTKSRSVHHGISSDDTFHQRTQGLSIRYGCLVSAAALWVV